MKSLSITIFFISIVLTTCKDKQIMTENSSCKQTIKQILSGKTESIAIPHFTCRKKEVEAITELSESYSTTLLGTDNIQVKFFMAGSPEAEEPFTFYFQGDSLVKISTDFPEISLEQLKNALGEPVRKMVSFYDIMKVEEGLWVYPEKGIAIHLIPEKTRISKIEYFPYTDLATYKNKLMEVKEPREFEVKE